MAESSNRGVAEALREAIERTLSVAGRPARTGSSAVTGERASELLDELARRGLGARDELANRIEALERRLSALEDALRTKPKPKAED